jgi:hypothetical protein
LFESESCIIVVEIERMKVGNKMSKKSNIKKKKGNQKISTIDTIILVQYNVIVFYLHAIVKHVAKPSKRC